MYIVQDRVFFLLLHNLANSDTSTFVYVYRIDTHVEKETLGMTSSFRCSSDGVIAFSFCVRVVTHMPID